jgi:hypothetical protein
MGAGWYFAGRPTTLKGSATARFGFCMGSVAMALGVAKIAQIVPGKV